MEDLNGEMENGRVRLTFVAVMYTTTDAVRR